MFSNTLPYVTHHLPGCGGLLKQTPQDFQVTEIPAYPFSGSGEHLLVEVEKQNLTSQAVMEHMVRTLGLKPVQLGHAGLKDRQGLTRQWFSLHSPQDLPLAQLETAELKIVSHTRHGNKLRPGHLAGNRFRITLRQVRPQVDMTALVETLVVQGFPNYYNVQRFGHQGQNALRGKDLVFSQRPSRKRSAALRFLVNAYQSALFNEQVALRLNELGSLSRMVVGDLAWLHRNGASFLVTPEELNQTQQRADAGEVSPSALMPGTHAPLAQGLPGQWESQLLQREGLNAEVFRRGGPNTAAKGERRAVRAFPQDMTWAPCDVNLDGDNQPAMVLLFTLGPGVYATSLLRELMKNDALGQALDTSPQDHFHAQS